MVCLHSVEDGHLLHELSAGAAIMQLQWTQQSEDRSVSRILFDLSSVHCHALLLAIDLKFDAFYLFVHIAISQQNIQDMRNSGKSICLLCLPWIQGKDCFQIASYMMLFYIK